MWQPLVAVTRTDKVCKPYVRRGPQPKRPYVGLFPWSLDDHWKQLEQSPLRLRHVVAAKLQPVEVSKYGRGTILDSKFYPNRRSIEDCIAEPMHVDTKSLLDTARDTLAVLFEAKAKPTGFWLPQQLEAFLTTGPGLYMLCLELLVEPEFDKRGQCVRFRALDSELAHAEAVRVTGMKKSITERYLDARAKYLEAP
jgi:hypothetical protein